MVVQSKCLKDSICPLLFLFLLFWFQMKTVKDVVVGGVSEGVSEFGGNNRCREAVKDEV